MKNELDEEKSKFQVYSSLFLEQYKSTTIHKHQKYALTATIEYFETKNNDTTLLVLPTGTGKSGIISFLPYVLNKRKILIITPSPH